MTDRIDIGLKDTGTAGCACCAAPTSTATEIPAAGNSAVTEEILVSGMTCSHCVSSVIEELSSVDGVQNVTVDLRAGGTSRVTIRSSNPLDPAQVKAAVDEAGYPVTDSPA
jgi:copper chaperone CopZ